MIKNILAAFLLCIALAGFAQNTITVNSPAEYDELKQKGLLKEDDRVIFAYQTTEKQQPVISPENSVQAYGSCQQLVPIDTSFQVVPFNSGVAPDYRNDDGSKSIALPFDFCFYGIAYDSVYINNNGNISLGASYGTFSSSSFPSSQYYMIAPFWADADTRNLLSGLVYYKLTPTALIVRWNEIGYYSFMADKTNDFQLIITDGNNPILPGGNNIGFAYGDMQWTTGSASGGNNGFGGTPATVGINKGNGVDFVQIGRFSLPSAVYDGPALSNDGINWLDGKSFFFDGCAGNVSSSPVISYSTICDTVTLCQNDSVYFLFNVTPQQSNIVVTDTSQNVNVSGINVTQGSPTIVTGWLSAATGPGVYPVTLNVINTIAFPPDTTFYTIFVKVQNFVVPPLVINGNTAICPSGFDTLIATPGFDSYYWTPGGSINDTIVITTQGTYSVTVSDSGCVKSSTIAIGQSLIDLQVTGNTEFCLGESTTLIATGADTYYWSYQNFIGDTLTFSPTNIALYSIIGTDTANNCTKQLNFLITVNICDWVAEQLSNSAINIYPNPATNNVVWNASGNVGNGTIQIFNAMGQMVFYKNITGVTETIAISHLAQGTYYLKTILKDGIKVSPFVKIAN